MNRDKKTYLEVLRCIALLLVISIHVVAIPIQNWSAKPGVGYSAYALVYTIGCMGVPLFLMISGALLIDNEKEISLGKLYKKMIPRILVPLIFFGYGYALLEIFFETRTINNSMFIEGVFRVVNGESWRHLWYCYLLIGIYLLLPIIKILFSVMTDEQVIYTMGVLVFLGFIIPTINSVLGLNISLEQPRPLCHITSFIMGYVISKYFDKKNFKKCIYISGVISTILLVVFSFVAGSINYESYAVLAKYNNILVFLASSMLFMLFTDKQVVIEGKMQKRYILSVARCSFGIYLIHPVIMNLMYKVFEVQPIMFNPVISIPVFILVFLIPSHLIILIMKRIPVVKNLV